MYGRTFYEFYWKDSYMKTAGDRFITSTAETKRREIVFCTEDVIRKCSSLYSVLQLILLFVVLHMPWCLFV